MIFQEREKETKKNTVLPKLDKDGSGKLVE